MKKNLNPSITCGIYLFNILSNQLLICHATKAAWNVWTIPKGLKDSNEDSYNAAVRELIEETGIDIRKINILKKYTLPGIEYKSKRKILESTLIITNTDLAQFQFTCSSMVDGGFPEIDAWKWVSIESAKNVLHESQQKNIAKINELILLEKTGSNK